MLELYILCYEKNIPNTYKNSRQQINTTLENDQQNG